MEIEILYIDTEGTFHPEKLIPLPERFRLDLDEVVSNDLLCFRDYNNEFFYHFLYLCIFVEPQTRIISSISSFFNFVTFNVAQLLKSIN